MKNSRNSQPDIDLVRGKRFAVLCEKIFPKLPRAKIGQSLGGYGESAVRNWESGTGLPNRALAELVVRGISMEWLLCGSGNMLRRDETVTTPQEPISELAKITPITEKNIPPQGGGNALGEHNIERLKEGATSLHIAIQTLLVEAARGNLAVSQISPIFKEMMETVLKFTRSESNITSRPNNA